MAPSERPRRASSRPPSQRRGKSSFPPPFVREVEHESFRPKLLAGIGTGYSTAVSLLVITLLADHYGAITSAAWAYALIATKVVTNTLAAIAWRTRKLVLPLSALNIAADVLLMTATIYFTGGVLSPAIALYFIEVAVMALLTNVGLTVTVLLGCVIAYASMAILVHTGVLPVVAPLAVPVEEMSVPILVVMIGFMSFITFVPGLYIAIIVERLRRSEERLRARAAELVEAGRAKSEFTANITHELRTPLHGILGVGEILEEGVYGPLTTEQIEAVRTIRTSAHGLLELIDSLLVVARSEALKLEVRPQVVDLGDVIGSVVATGKLVVGSRALEIDSAVASDLPTVETDRQKLVQILVNLLANAIKFTPDRGKVRIEASREGDHVLVRVTDTGIGIAPEALDKIFEPFTQAEALELREHGGAGLGLYVVRTLSSLLRIDVDVESEVGRGSTFTLRVPPTLSASAAR